MSRRAHISDRTKLAAALLALGDVEYEHAKMMHRDQIISLYNFDHGRLHAFDGEDEFWNLTPRLIVPHRKKSARDKAIVSKAVRLDEKQEAHNRRLLAKNEGDTAPRKRRWGSRPFPKGRKMQSRGFDRRRP